MKVLFSLLFLLLVFSCEKQPQNARDLILANLDATGGEKNWKDLSSIQIESSTVTTINGNDVSSIKTINSIQLPNLQKEEIFTNDSLDILTINNLKQNFYFKFENGKPVGYTELDQSSISVKMELELLNIIDKLRLEEGNWNELEVFKIENTETREEYIYDKETFYLIAYISETPYGTSTTSFGDYRKNNEFYFSHYQINKIPSSSYKVSTTISDIRIAPDFDKSTFKVQEDWIVLKEGKDLPEFETSLFNKESVPINKKSLAGKVVLIDFWATWCKPCIEEFPNIKEQYKKYEDKNFEVLTISLDENERALTQYLAKNPFPWINAWEKEGFKSSLAKDLQLASIPKSILIDQNGKILAMDTGAKGENLNEKLVLLFN